MEQSTKASGPKVMRMALEDIFVVMVQLLQEHGSIINLKEILSILILREMFLKVFGSMEKPMGKVNMNMEMVDLI